MSFKLLNFSGFSFFEDFFNNPTSEDPDVKLLTLRVKNSLDTMLRYFGLTTLTVGYLTNTKFKIKDTGLYVITINSHFKNGPHAIYCISRSVVSESGVVKEIVSSKGKNGECLELDWNPYEYPLLTVKLKLTEYNQDHPLHFFVKISNTL